MQPAIVHGGMAAVYWSSDTNTLSHVSPIAMDEIASKRESELRPGESDDADATLVAALSGPATMTPVEKGGIGQAGKSSHELKALHGLRFFAAFCILFSHACSWLANFKDSKTIYSFGDIFTVFGMPLFFVLSGFVIHYNYSRLFSTMRPRWAIVEFLGARFARIYPLFICFFLIGMAVDEVLLWYPDHKLNLFLVLAHFLTLTQSWVYIVLFGDRMLLDGPFGLSWSLSTEFFFYVFYVLLVLHLTRLRGIISLLMTAGAMSVLVLAVFAYAAGHREAIAAFARQQMNDQFGRSDRSAFWWFFYYSPYGRVFEFILGCLTAQIYALLPERPVSSREARGGRVLLMGSLVFLGAFALTYRFAPFGPVVQIYVELLKLNFVCAVAIAAVIFCVSRYRSSAFALILSTPLMVSLGDLSYSIYTVHTWTLRIFERPQMTFTTARGWEAVFRIVLAIALTIILSTATYRFIEVPARAWLRKVVARHLLRKFGARETNMLSDVRIYSSSAAMVFAVSFVVMIGGLLIYQFLIVPHYAPYAR
jgi:peptidoglycan/LPS O-acetylase OafA/YrhL